MTAKRPFEDVVSDHGRAILRVCRAMLGPTDAEDAWSDTFLAALEAYPRLEGDANVEAWLVTIAHRKAIDALRRRQRHALPVADVPLPPAANNPEGRDLDLVRSLARLPDKQRFAIVYHYLGGLSYGEVAEVIGGTTEAARRAAADGVANLRKATHLRETSHLRELGRPGKAPPRTAGHARHDTHTDVGTHARREKDKGARP